MELEALQNAVSDIESLGASIVAISPQLGKYSKQAARKNNLAFPVLCDKGNEVASRFGLVFDLPGDLRGLYSKFGIDLERFNGDDSWTLAMPGGFILDSRGTVLGANVHPDYTKRPEPYDIVEVLKTGMSALSP